MKKVLFISLIAIIFASCTKTTQSASKTASVNPSTRTIKLKVWGLPGNNITYNFGEGEVKIISSNTVWDLTKQIEVGKAVTLSATNSNGMVSVEIQSEGSQVGYTAGYGIQATNYTVK